MPRVNIPSIGDVNFPDTMSSDDIAAASKRLYEQKNPPRPAGPTPFQQQAAAHKASIQAEQAQADQVPGYFERVGEGLQTLPGLAKTALENPNPLAGLMQAVSLPFEAGKAVVAPAVEPYARALGANQPVAQAIGETAADVATAFAPIPGLAPEESAAEKYLASRAATNAEIAAAKVPRVVEDEGKTIIGNPAAPPASEARLTTDLEAKGVDTSKPQQTMDHMAAEEGIQPPVVESTGAPLSKTEGEKVELETGIPSEVAHELEHVKSDTLGTPEPPEDNAVITQRAIQREEATPTYFEKYAGSINMDRINTSQDVKNIIYDIGSKISRDPIPLSEIQAAAEDMNVSVDDVLARAANNRDLPGRVVAARIANVRASEDYVTARDAWRAEQTPANLEAVKSAQTTMLKMMAAVSEEAHTAGLTLGSFRIPATGLMEGQTQISGQGTLVPEQVLRGLKDLIGRIELKGPLSDEITQKIAATDLENPGQRNKLFTFLSTKGSTTREKIQEYFVNSLLSGPPTQVLKAASDLTMTFFRPIVDASAGAVDLARSAITGHERTRFIGEGMADLQGFANGLSDAWKAMVDTYTGKVPELFRGGRGAAIPGPIGEVVRFPVKNLSAITDFFKTLESRASLYQQGYRNALVDGASHDEAMLAAHAAAQNPTKEMLNVAKDEGMRWTFMSDPGSFGAAIERARGSTWVGKFIMPFIRVPMNIAKFGYQTSALALPQAIKKLASDSPDATVRTAQAVLGTAFQAFASTLVASGRITGGGPADPREKAAWLATGKQPYSIMAPDGKWYSYLRIEPIGMVVGMAADATDIIADAPRHVVPKVISAVSLAAGRTILSKTYLSGLSSFIEAIQDPARFGERFAGGMVGGFIPSLAAKAAQSQDPYLRDARTFLDQLKVRIPSVREEVAPKRDIFGEPIPAPGTPAQRLLSPVLSSEPRGGKIANDMVEVDAKVGPLSRTMTVMGKKLQLDENDYDLYQQVSGSAVKDRLAAIENRGNFDALPDATRRMLIEKLVRQARELGHRQFVDEIAKSGRLKVLMDQSDQLARDMSLPSPYSKYIKEQRAEQP